MSEAIQLQLPERSVAANEDWFARVGLRAPSTLSDLLHLMGVDDGDRYATDALAMPVRQMRAEATLFHEGAAAEAIYFVRAGTFKCFQTAEDGYEQVLGFACRGDVLGFDAVCSAKHPSAAVALEDSSVYVVPVRDLFSLGERAPALNRVLHLAISRELMRRGEVAEVMAAVGAEVRLARFLVQLSGRMAACGQSPRRIVLRMSRRDIASHLGVAHETVSRSFTALVERGYLCVRNREVEILDLEGLRDSSRSTRGLAEEMKQRHHAQGPAEHIDAFHGAFA